MPAKFFAKRAADQGCEKCTEVDADIKDRVGAIDAAVTGLDPMNVATVSDRDDQHDQMLVADLVNDAIIACANPVEVILTHQFL